MNKLTSLIHSIACLFLLGISTHLFANNVRFNHLTIADGLASEYVNQTFQQRNGFIWFATNSGASRYDGKSFLHFSYSPGAPTHISNNIVVQIFEDRQGNIWILTEGGLNKVNLKGDIEYFLNDDSNPKSINSNWMHYIYQDSSDRIWVTTNEGLNLYQPESNNFSQFTGTIKDTSYTIAVNDMIETSANNFILATLEGLAFFNAADSSFILESDRISEVPNWCQDTLQTLTRTKSGRVLIGTRTQGMIDFDPVSLKFKQYRMEEQGTGLAEDWVTSIIERTNGELVIAHEFSGVTVISANRKTFTYLIARDFDDTSLISNNVNQLFEDQSGLLWVATEAGISKQSYLQNSTALFSKQADKLGLSGNIVYNTTLMDDQQILIASSGGLNKLRFADGNIEQIELFSQDQKSLHNNHIYDVSSNLKGEFWLVSSNGIHQYDPQSNKVVNYLNGNDNRWGLTESEYWTSLADTQEGVWVTGSQEVGLFKFDPEKGVVKRFLHALSHLYTKEGDYTADKIMSNNGDIWLATTDGIYRINPQSGLEQHIRLGNDDNKLMRTTSIIEDTQGVIWATAGGAGLIKLTVNEDNVPQLTRFTTLEGLASKDLLTVSEYQGKLWLTTKDQLFSYDPNSQQSIAYPSLFNLPGISFVEGSQTLANGTLYLGSNKGLVSVKLNQIESNRFNSPVQITQAIAGNQVLLRGLDSDKQDKAYISYEQNNLSFSYAALDYNNPSQNVYRYLLQGSDDNWIEVGNTTSVSYNNLRAGNYIFKVSATNSDGLWSDQVATFTFEIEQPWWFYALWMLAGALAIGLLLFFVNRRMHVKTLYQNANYDSLTGLANRYHFNKSIEGLVASTNSNFTLIIVDLDGFKEVNDIYGHSVGDELLIQASTRMKLVLREGDFLARLGGDEFALIINQNAQSSGLLNILERLRQALENSYELKDHSIRSSASIGAASFPSDTNESDSLLVYADTAMFAAKQSGRNAIRFFNESLSQELEQRTQLRQKLQTAIDNEAFELYYQPQVDQFSKQTTGFEALIRWFQADGSSIPPDMFIPEAERNGSIVEIGRWVLQSACKQAAIWHEQGLLSGKISVNVSPAQITKSDLVGDVKKALEQNNLAPEYLELEITESVLVDNIDLTLAILKELKTLGVSIALDDFGSGYSSLNYLTKFPIDTLKIDRSFIISVETEMPTKMVLRNIYTLANDLSMEVIAEGVETQDQLQIIASLGGRIIQGYYYSRPLSAKDATERLRSEINK